MCGFALPKGNENSKTKQKTNKNKTTSEHITNNV